MHFLAPTDGTVQANDHLCTLGQRRKTNFIIRPLEFSLNKCLWSEKTLQKGSKGLV